MRYIIFLMLLIGCSAYMISATPSHTIDGDTVMYVYRADKRGSALATTDGYQVLARENKSALYYAKQKKRKSEIVASRRIAKGPASRSRLEERWLRRHGVRLKK